MRTSKYLSDGAIVVYLDQCVVSRFLEKSPRTEWKQLCSLLLNLCTTGRIICPCSLEHLVESSSLSDEDAIFLGRILARLSNGWDVRVESDLIARQIMERLRGLTTTRDSFLQKGVFVPLSSAKQLKQLRYIKAKTDTRNDSMVEAANYVNSLTRHGPRMDRQVHSWMRAEKHRSTLVRLMDAIHRSIRNGFIQITADPTDPELAQWETSITYQMITQHHMAIPEARQLLRLLKEQGLEFSPTLLIKAELDARQFAKQEKVEARDQYDITHAACALPYADIYVTDGGKAAAIRELKLDKRFQTKVLSTKQGELGEFLRELEEIAR